MKTINLDTREKQNVYMNATRQDLLRLLYLEGRAMTPKELSDKLGISASSVTFHIQKLMSLGVVELERTEKIHGITARYYRPVRATVHLGALVPGGDESAQTLFVRRMVENVLAGFQKMVKMGKKKGLSANDSQSLGDMSSGVIYLTREEAAQLQRQMIAFLGERDEPRPGTEAYEYVVMAYNATAVNEDVE